MLDATSERPFSTAASVLETGSVYGADESKSPRGSPGRQTTYESPSQEYSGNQYTKGSDGDAEIHSFGANPGKTDSPRADNTLQKNDPFTFEDSVPGTPISRAGNSPRYSIDSRDPFVDSFSRYDSFSTRGRSSSPGRENLGLIP
ncbi:UNVERIFIED_CONTAM: hypothetical protein Sradi_2449300 [Sesamum radiatum]|uniref:Uncharacterized protein n=1 Tax=Sesamum radiatum TaxID=300843 RepID=A0AAW2SJI4_SESRA